MLPELRSSSVLVRLQSYIEDKIAVVRDGVRRAQSTAESKSSNTSVLEGEPLPSTAGRRPDDRVSVVAEDGSRTLTQYRLAVAEDGSSVWEPEVLDGHVVDLTTVAMPAEWKSDGVPPAASPEPLVGDGFGFISVRLPEVENADPVMVRVHVSASSPVDVSGAAVATVVNGGSQMVRELADGTPLEAGGVYYVRTVAYDADGDAPPSGEASGRALAVDFDQVSEQIRDAIEAADTAATNAQSQAQQALQEALDAYNAAQVADGKADTAQQTADSKASPAEVEAARQAAIAAAALDATAKSEQAEADAIAAAAADAQAKADAAAAAAEQAAKDYAELQASGAGSAALEAAQEYAEQQAAAAKTAAEQAAALDAQAKAEAAEAAAIAAAATDAQAKADAAEAAAKAAAQDAQDAADAAQGTADQAASAAATADSKAAAAQSAAQEAQSTANSKGKVIIQSATPATADRLAQNLWIDTGNGNVAKRWNGSAWVVVQDAAIQSAAQQAAAAQQLADDAMDAATQAQTSADGKNSRRYGPAITPGGTPTTPAGTKDGDTYFGRDGARIVQQWAYVGGAWEQETVDVEIIANLDAGVITAWLIEAQTFLGKLAAFEEVQAEDLAADFLTANEALIRALQVIDLSVVNFSGINITGGAINIARGEGGVEAATFGEAPATPDHWEKLTWSSYGTSGIIFETSPGPVADGTGRMRMRTNVISPGVSGVHTFRPQNFAQTNTRLTFDYMWNGNVGDEGLFNYNSVALLLRCVEAELGSRFADAIHVEMKNGWFYASAGGESTTVLGDYWSPAPLPKNVWHTVEIDLQASTLAYRIYPKGEAQIPAWTAIPIDVLRPREGHIVWRVWNQSAWNNGAADQNIYIDNIIIQSLVTGFHVNPDGSGDWPYTLDPIRAAQSLYYSRRRSPAKGIPSGAWTSVDYNVLDKANGPTNWSWDSATGLLIPVSGRWIVSAGAHFDARNSGRRGIMLALNGNPSQGVREKVLTVGAANQPYTMDITQVVELEAGTRLNAIVYQDSGSGLNVLDHTASRISYTFQGGF